jgi:hypothetical protein
MTHYALPSFTAPAPRLELLVVVLCMWLALVSVPLGLGGIGISWDALNHHVYLGWTAFSPRFDRDWLASGHQATTWPYLYWPFFKLVELQWPGRWAGAVLASLHVLVVPALWIIARACIPERSWEATAMRAGAVLLAFLGQLTISMMDTTANDLYAASPLVWAVAFGMLALRQPATPGWLTNRRAVMCSGAFSGLAVAFKFSNGPLVLALPLLWALVPGTRTQRLASIARGTVWSVAAFIVAYGWWGWQLWQVTGNPVYPFFEHQFATWRELAGWRQP